MRGKYWAGRFLALVGLIMLSPVFLIIGILVKLSSPGPVFFTQVRVGQDGVPFKIIKFRSMRTTGNGDRRTKIGKILRNTSLDEIPQFINVLKGEMAIVGPRPEIVPLADKYARTIQHYHERHRVRPGITGLSQVKGLRGNTCLIERTFWDNRYIDEWSLWLDIKILFLTFKAVVTHRELTEANQLAIIDA